MRLHFDEFLPAGEFDWRNDVLNSYKPYLSEQLYANINEINLKSSEMLLFCEYRINNRHIYFSIFILGWEIKNLKILTKWNGLGIKKPL